MVITLKEDTKTLDEVVVVGYQEVRRRDLTGSVAKANMADVLTAPSLHSTRHSADVSPEST